MSVPGGGSERLQVFMSYSRTDVVFVDQLSSALRLCGFGTAVDRTEVTGGEEFEKRLLGLIQDAGTVVLVLSPASIASRHVTWEIEQALQSGKRIIPVVCEAIDELDVPASIAALDYTYFYANPRHPGSGFGTGLTELVAALNTDLVWVGEHTRLLQRAIDWDRAGRPTVRLLSGSDVAAAKDWASRRPAKAPPLTALHLELLKASEEEEAARRGAERRRHEEMAAAIDARASALQEAERQSHARRRLRITAFTLLSALTLFAVWQSHLALQEKDRASGLNLLATIDKAKVDANTGNGVQRLLLMLDGRDEMESGWMANLARSVRVGVARQAQGLGLLPASLRDAARRSVETETLRQRAIGTSERAIYASLNSRRELALLAGHEGEITTLVFSADGRRFASGDASGVVALWETATQKRIARLAGHDRQIRSLQFSDDGRLLISGSADKSARIWNGLDGSAIGVLRGHAAGVYMARFIDGGRRAVTSSEDGTAQVWDVAALNSLATFRGHKQRIGDLVVTPDGRHLITASADWRLGVWDLKTLQHVRWLEWQETAVYSIAIDRAGKKLATASSDGWPQVWDIASADPKLWSPMFVNGLKGHEGEVFQVRFNKAGTELLSASEDGHARIWSLRDGSSRLLIGHREKINSARFDADERRILTASQDGSARLWDTLTAQPIARFGGHSDGVNVAELSPDNRLIVTGGADGSLRVWDAATAQEMSRFPPPGKLEGRGHTHPIVEAALSPDGRTAASASLDKSAILWPLDGSQPIKLEHSENVWHVEFSPDGRRVLTGSDDKTAVIWDARTGARLHELKGHTDWLAKASYSPDGRWVITASGDKEARLWEAETGKEMHRLVQHSGPLTWVEFSNDSDQVATASRDRTVRVWDVRTGGLKRTFEAGAEQLCIRFSPDDRLLVSTGNDGVTRVWDLSDARADARPLRVLRGHTNKVNYAVFDSTGRYLATASYDQTARVWDLQKIRDRDAELSSQAFIGHGGYVGSLMFSKSGELLLTASEDREARIWDSKTAIELGRIVGHSGQVMKAMFLPDEERVLTASRDKTLRVWKRPSNGQIYVPGYALLDVAEKPRERATPRSITRRISVDAGQGGTDSGLRRRVVLNSLQELTATAQEAAPRCLTLEERRQARLDDAPPDWCIERKKWPYHTSAWSDWLAKKKRGISQPVLGTFDWQAARVEVGVVAAPIGK